MLKIPYTPVYINNQLRKLESVSYNEQSLSPQKLMEKAGKAAYEFVSNNWQNAEKILVVTGSGNNGGDGYVLAKYAFKKGLKICILHVGKESSTNEAKAAMEKCRKLQIPIITNITEINFAKFDIIVDALLGIGLKGNKLQKDAREVISVINSINKPVVSLDCPSGVNTDTGNVLEIAVRADATITFIGLKRGLLTGEAKDYCGEITCNNLDLPERIFQTVKTNIKLYEIDDLKLLLPERKQTSYKNDYGHVLVIGGNFGFAGAAKLAATGALRSGAGLVSVATRAGHTNGIIADTPEIMVHEVKNKDDLQPLLNKCDVIVFGPGLGQDEWAQNLFKLTLKESKPVIIDADGLNLLAKSEPISRNNWILTPHPGEAARLLSVSTSKIRNNRFEAIKHLRQLYGGVIILKGAGSLILGASNITTICKYGNPGMASGGMGDILSGTIAAMVAQAPTQEEAAILGTHIHSYAADLASKLGERGLTASDLLPFVRKIVN